MSELRCAWTELLPPPKPTPRLEEGVNCAVAVVGAGLIGPATARRLAELLPGEPVVVLDAGESLKERPVQVNARHPALSRQRFDWPERIVEHERIDCGWARAGHHYAAASDGGLCALDGVLRQFDWIGLNAERPRCRGRARAASSEALQATAAVMIISTFRSG